MIFCLSRHKKRPWNLLMLAQTKPIIKGKKPKDISNTMTTLLSWYVKSLHGMFTLYGGKKSPLISVHVANRYITWLNWAKSGSAKSGTWPMSSWIMSGSGVYKGLEPCLIYWVAWKTRKASPARKSREEIRPATGRRLKPEHSKSWYSK